MNKNLFPASLGLSEWANERENERSGAREQSEQCAASEWVSSAWEWENGWASGPALCRLVNFISIYPVCNDPKTLLTFLGGADRTGREAEGASDPLILLAPSRPGAVLGRRRGSAIPAACSVDPRTTVWNKQESRRKYWATCLSVCSYARTAHFAHSLACGKVNN